MRTSDQHSAGARRGRAVWLWAAVLISLAVPVVVDRVGPIVTAQSLSYSSIPLQSWRVNGEGRAILKVGNVVYVGGSFSRATSPNGADSATRSNLAAFDARTGALITTFRADTDGRVFDLATDGTSLFVSGTFDAIGGVTRRKIAAVDLATGAVRTGFRADAGSTVYRMSIAAGKLYVSGVFTNINGVSRQRIGAVDLATGAVDPNFAPVADGTVKAIAATPDGSKVFVGGTYSTINGVADIDISVVDGSTGARISPELDGVVGFVDDLEVTPDGQRLLAAHSGVPGVGNRTAVYDIATGQRQWYQAVEGDVQNVHLIDDVVWSGFHDGGRRDAATRLAGNALSNGIEDDSFRPSFDRFMGVWSIHGDADALVVAGDFSVVSGIRAEGFAIFPSSAPTPIVAAVWGGDNWKYLDDGSDQGTAWAQPGFDDSSWKTGVGEFGYGNGGERTKIASGPSSNKHITTYFRTTFEASMLPEAAAIYMRVDDGAVVYVNGIEAARDNLADGPVTAATLATDRSGNAEGSSRYFAIDPTLIVAGSNTVAVEVHQSSPTTDDMKFFSTFVAYGESDGNRIPDAVIGVDTPIGAAPLPIVFDGTGSTDPDGTVTSWAWDFGDGTTASGAAVSHTFAAPGNYIVTLTVADDAGALGVTTRVITALSAPPADRVLDLPPTATWSYLDDGSSLDATWTQLDFDMNGWSTGVGEFGYGDGDENTVVSFGPSTGSKYVTTYFRAAFAASGVPADVTLSLRVDDGAVAYLNGTEVARFNLPPGPISSVVAATDAISGSGERADRPFTIDPSLIQQGPNVLAVEVHQNTPASSDLSFLASLTATGVPGPPPPPPPPGNTAPVAVASATPLVGDAPLLATFDGSNSTDPDGTVVAWEWNFGDGATATGPTAGHTYAVAGNYTATLSVTDDQGAVATTTIAITAMDPIAPPPPPPPGLTVDVAPTATWTYSDRGDVVGADWATSNYDDSAWATGVGEFGYGDGDEATVVSYGPSAGQKYTTTYFRTDFTATATPENLTLSLRVDDGAVVYLNGVEAARFNLPIGPVGYATLAPEAIFGSGETLDRAFVLDPSLVVAGSNVLAVEVHQNTLGSSDLTFLASLIGTGDAGTPPPPPPTTLPPTPPTTIPPPPPTTIPPPPTTIPPPPPTTIPPNGPVVDVPPNAVWSYSDLGDVVGASWATTTYDDSAWATGVGEFGYGDGDENTVVSFGPSAGRKFTTTYFRTEFTASAVPTALELLLRVDDGAVVYVNGVEVARFNLPTGPISYATRAPAAIADAGEREDRAFTIDPTLIVPGANVLAVEVHQNTLGSSDLTFLASLRGTL